MAATVLDDAIYRKSIGSFAAGVTVITTKLDGVPYGMSASSVASLSLDPILLLVCVKTTLPTHSAIESRGRFAVNILGEGQENLAYKFARPSEDKFQGVKIEDHESSIPLLADAIAFFVCEVDQRLPGGDHSIFIGRVTDCGHTHDTRPLLYFRSGFGTFETDEEALRRVADSWGAATGSWGGL